MSLLRSMMRARNLNASRPLTRQLRASSTNIPATRYITQEPTYHAIHPNSTTTTLPLDYSGADSEKNYKVSMNSFQSPNANIKKTRNAVLDLMAEHPPPRRVSRQMVVGLGSDLAHLEDVHEQYQEHVDHLNKHKDTQFIFNILAYIVGSLTGCVLGDPLYKWMNVEHKVANESDVD